jgi:hypothetical protein
MGYEPSTEDRKCKNCKQSWCGTKQYIPNLCVAHKVSEKCMDQNVNKSSRCDVCGQNENVFVGDTAREDFCRWLFSEYNAGAKVLCHNFKSYDSYLILQYLYKHAILPEFIMTGSKFMSIDVPQCKIRILDSIHFLPMALEKLPDSFGLTEMAKGYFPHLFNTMENQNTSLPNLPDVEYYNPGGRKATKEQNSCNGMKRTKITLSH